MFTYVLDAQKDQLIETVLLSTICEMKKKTDSRVSSISFGVISGGQNCYQLVALGFVTGVTVSFFPSQFFHRGKI